MIGIIFHKDIYHIRVVPVAGSCVGHDDVLVVSVVIYDRLDGGPRVLNVVKVAPQVAVLYYRCKVWLECENKSRLVHFRWQYFSAIFVQNYTHATMPFSMHQPVEDLPTG